MAGKEDRTKYKQRCPHCGGMFKSPQTLQAHILAKHKEIDKKTVKTGGGIKMGEGDLEKKVEEAIGGVRNSMAELSKKVETQANSIDKIINSIPNVVAESLKKVEQEKKQEQERSKKAQEAQKKMKDMEELLKHKEDLLSFCKVNPKLCKVEIDKVLPKDEKHLPHETVAETLDCPICGPRLLRGISESLVKDEEFAKKFIGTIKANKADTKLEELIKLGKETQG